MARGGDRGRGRDRALARPRPGGGPRAPLRPTHLHRPARAAPPALLPRPRRGFLAVTTPMTMPPKAHPVPPKVHPAAADAIEVQPPVADAKASSRDLRS